MKNPQDNKKWKEKFEEKFDKQYTKLLKKVYEFQKKEYDPNIAFSFFHQIKKVVLRELSLQKSQIRKEILEKVNKIHETGDSAKRNLIPYEDLVALLKSKKED